MDSSLKQKRVLVFNVNWLGDVLFSTATIRNIRYNYPDSHIVCIVPTSCIPVLSGNPHLNEIIPFDERGQDRGLWGKLRLVNLLRQKHFTVVFLLHRSFSRALLCRLAGIKELIGYYTKRRGFLLRTRIFPPDANSLHRIDYYLGVIKGAGLKVKDRHLEFYFGKEEERFVNEFLVNNGAQARPLVGLNPGGNWLPKRWPKDYWIRLAEMLVHDLGADVIVTGGASDYALAGEIQAKVGPRVKISCAVFNLKHFAALAKRLDCFISADSGPLHIANALGAKKIIALFGPTDPLVTAPYPLDNVILLQKDIGCKIPCYNVDCPDNRCMRAILPEFVFAEIAKLLK